MSRTQASIRIDINELNERKKLLKLQIADIGRLTKHRKGFPNDVLDRLLSKQETRELELGDIENNLRILQDELAKVKTKVSPIEKQRIQNGMDQRKRP